MAHRDADSICPPPVRLPSTTRWQRMHANPKPFDDEEERESDPVVSLVSDAPPPHHPACCDRLFWRASLRCYICQRHRTAVGDAPPLAVCFFLFACFACKERRSGNDAKRMSGRQRERAQNRSADALAHAIVHTPPQAMLSLQAKKQKEGEALAASEQETKKEKERRVSTAARRRGEVGKIAPQTQRAERG